MAEEKGPYERFVEKFKSPILPILEKQNSRSKNWEKFKRTASALKEQVKFGYSDFYIHLSLEFSTEAFWDSLRVL